MEEFVENNKNIEKKKDPIIQVNEDLFSIIEQLREDFEEKHGIKLSYQQSTKIIADRINKAGGIKV